MRDATLTRSTIRRRATTVLAGLLCAQSCTPGDRADTPTAGASLSPADQVAIRLLFAGNSGSLSEIEQIGIVRALGLSTSDDGTALVDEVCGQPLHPQVRLQDLGGDGEPEVIVDWGNACTSGMAGTSVTVFVKDPSGQFRSNFGFPGMIAEVLPTSGQGFRDLLIGGPGFCFAIWRWNGQAYEYLRSEPQAPGGCDP